MSKTELFVNCNFPDLENHSPTWGRGLAVLFLLNSFRYVESCFLFSECFIYFSFYYERFFLSLLPFFRELESIPLDQIKSHSGSLKSIR